MFLQHTQAETSVIWPERRRPKRLKTCREAKELLKKMEIKECHWRLASRGLYSISSNEKLCPT